MQLLIDTATETPRGIRLYMAILGLIVTDMDRDYPAEAAARPAPKPLHPPAPPLGPVPAPPLESPPLPPGNVPPAPVEHPPFHPDVPTGTMDPAQVFGQNPTGAGVVMAPAAPVSPPVPVAPVASAPPAPPIDGSAVNSSERDSEGIPWDDRIHSDTRKKNADGTWRYRRNLDAAVKAAVYAQLKGQQPLAASPVSVPQPFTGQPDTVPLPFIAPGVPQLYAAAGSVPVPPAPAAGSLPSVIPPAPSNVLPFTGGQAVPVPPAPILGMRDPAQSAVVPAAPVTSFRDLLNRVNVAIHQGKLTQAQLTEACASAKVGSITELASQPMLVPAVAAYLAQYLAA